MLTSPVKHAVSLGLLALLTSCQGKEGRDAPDAGPADAAAPRVIPARTPAQGELLADVNSSKVTVAVIKDKNSKLPVNGTLLLRDGRVTLDGPSPSAQLSIDLTTLETAIPTRNERVKKLFFETNNRSWETIELAVPVLPPAALTALREKRRATHVELQGEVTFHSVKKPITLVVDAAYEPGGTLVVKSVAPFDVNIADFGLSENLHRLSLICQHDSIDEIVKVEVTVELPTK